MSALFAYSPRCAAGYRFHPQPFSNRSFTGLMETCSPGLPGFKNLSGLCYVKLRQPVFILHPFIGLLLCLIIYPFVMICFIPILQQIILYETGMVAFFLSDRYHAQGSDNTYRKDISHCKKCKPKCP